MSIPAGIIGNQMSASKATKRAAAADRGIARAQAARQRTQQRRESAVAQAELTNVSAQVGAAGSSSAVGAQGSLQSQLGANLSFLDSTAALGQEAASQRSKAATKLAQASMFQTIGDLAMTGAKI